MAENPVQNVTFASSAGEAHGYLALPPGGTGPGLIVIQEWWGLESSLAHTTDHFAAAGFVALAPDLYGGETTHDPDEALKLMQSLPMEQAARDLGGAVDFLLGHDAVTGSAVGAVGFCMGGGFVLVLAAQQGRKVAAAVPFYAAFGEAVPAFTGLTAKVQGHFGGTDSMIPTSRVEEIKAKVSAAGGAEPEFFVYPGAGHAFGNEENLMGTHDAEAGELAFTRATSFLHAAVG